MPRFITALFGFATIILATCEMDMDKYFISSDDKTFKFDIDSIMSIDPFNDNLIHGQLSLDYTDLQWHGIEPEITLQVSHGRITSPPYSDQNPGASTLTQKTAGQRIVFDWKLTPPYQEPSIRITAKMNLTTGGDLTESHEIILSHLSPDFVDLIIDKDSLEYAAFDTVLAMANLSNVNGLVGELIPVEVKQSSDNSKQVRILREGNHAVNGNFTFKIINPSGNSGSVRVWVVTSGIESDKQVIHFK